MLRHVHKLLRAIEELLTSRKQEIGSAIDAPQLLYQQIPCADHDYSKKPVRNTTTEDAKEFFGKGKPERKWQNPRNTPRKPEMSKAEQDRHGYVSIAINLGIPLTDVLIRTLFRTKTLMAHQEDRDHRDQQTRDPLMFLLLALV